MTFPLFDPEKLVGFVQELHQHRFVFSTEQYTAAQDLLITLVAEGRVPSDPQNLCTWLAPIFCTSPEEQRIFHDLFKQWLKRQSQYKPDARETEGRTRTISQPVVRDVQTSSNNIFEPSYIISILTLTIITALILLAYLLPLPDIKGVVADEYKNPVHGAEVTVEVIRDFSNANSAGLTVGAIYSYTNETGQFSITNVPRGVPVNISVSHAKYETFRLDLKTINDTPLSITLKKLPGLFRDSPGIGDGQNSANGQQPYKSVVEIYLERFKWMAVGTLLLPFVSFSVWWIRRAYRLRRLQLIKQGSDEEYSADSLMVKGIGDKLFREQTIRPIAQGLRQHRHFDSNELDLTLTVSATTREAGWFTPVYALRKEQPEYIALIDRANFGDYQTLFGETLINQLVEQGVIVEQYFFRGSPLVCRKKGSEEKLHDLQELKALHPNHFLLVFGEGDELINAVTGEPQIWLNMLTAWSVCALLTPKEPADWGYQERALSEQGLMVVPADNDGMAFLIETIYTSRAPKLGISNTSHPFPDMLYERPRRWLQHPEPKRAVANKLCFQLRRFLGNEEYYLLGACAIYPVLCWELTLYLAYTLGGPDRLEERLRLLARLPWFRHGSMPDWLRMRLISALPKEYENSTRLALRELLESSREKPDNSFFKLPYTKAEGKNGPTRGGQGLWSGFVERMRAWNLKRLWQYLTDSGLKHGPLKDPIFLAFMSWRKPRKLSLEVPNTLEQILYPEGQAALGLRPVIVLLALLCSVITFLALMANSIEAPEQSPSRAIYTLQDQSPTVHSVAFSPTGKQMCTGGWGGAVKLWDVDTGTEIITLRGHSSPVYSVAFSPDGKMLASGKGDGTTDLWDLYKDAKMVTFTEHSGPVYSVAFSPDSKLLASGGWDGSVVVCNASVDTQIVNTSKHSNMVSSVAFSPDGKLLASSSWDGTVKLWDVVAGAELSTLGNRSSPVYSVAFSPHDKMLAVGCWNGVIELWDTADFGKRLNIFSEKSGSIYSVAFSPDSKTLASGNARWTIGLWDVVTGAELTTFSGHSGPVYSVSFSPDGKTLASGSQDSTIKLWDLTGIK